MKMDLAITKDRTTYALNTFKDSWLSCIPSFIPLVLAWAASLLGPCILLGVGVACGQIFDHMVLHAREASWGTLIGLVVPGSLIAWLWAGWIYVTLKVARGMPVQFMDIVRPLNQALSAAVVLIISTVCIGLTSWTVIVSAYLFSRWQLAPYYVVDRNFGPLHALKRSWSDTESIFIPLAIMDLCFFGLHLLTAATVFGPCACFIAAGVASAIVYSRWLTDPDNPAFKITELESPPPDE
jgi:hypothetical protein